jgi:hypothetical protein
LSLKLKEAFYLQTSKAEAAADYDCGTIARCQIRVRAAFELLEHPPPPSSPNRYSFSFLNRADRKDGGEIVSD